MKPGIPVVCIRTYCLKPVRNFDKVMWIFSPGHADNVTGKERAYSLAGLAAIDNDLMLDPPTVYSLAMSLRELYTEYIPDRIITRCLLTLRREHSIHVKAPTAHPDVRYVLVASTSSWLNQLVNTFAPCDGP